MQRLIRAQHLQFLFYRRVIIAVGDIQATQTPSECYVVGRYVKVLLTGEIPVL